MPILPFQNRREELRRLTRLAERGESALVIVSGRRRIGKTRLLLEWVSRSGGLYTVADTSTADVQRRYMAQTVASRLKGFADVDYPTWEALFSRLARDAEAAGWPGPIVVDELPYLLASAPELASTLQRWMDHDARRARLVVAFAGSSQRMMKGLALSSDSPLFGRATEVFELAPMGARNLFEALGIESIVGVVEAYAAWGGVPRYWELAAGGSGPVALVIDELVLDPRGPLHREPDHLLIEELPPALEARPLLDAIGGGAHRVSEIAGRIGRPATSLSRPLGRLQDMQLVRREVPFGEPERRSKRSLYRLSDPFFRLWFRVVAPNRALLASSRREVRLALLESHWPGLVSAVWEDLCRSSLGDLANDHPLATMGPWGPAGRWWRGNDAEWDLVAESVTDGTLLVAEAKWSASVFSARSIEKVAHELAGRRIPELRGRPRGARIVRALFVPEVEASSPSTVGDVHVVRGRDWLHVHRDG